MGFPWLRELLGYTEAQQAGAAVVTRNKLNFVSGATVVDNPSTGATDVTVSGGGGAGVMRIHAVTVNLVDPTVNNLNPSGFTDEFSGSGVIGVALQITASQAVLITGLTPPPQPDGKWAVPVYLRNLNFPMTLGHQNAGSTAAWRFDIPGDIDLTLATHDTVILLYDFTASRWTVF